MSPALSEYEATSKYDYTKEIREAMSGSDCDETLPPPEVRPRIDRVSTSETSDGASNTTTTAQPENSTTTSLFRTGLEIAAYTAEEPEWIVRGLAARTAITMLSAKPKAGKTHFSLDLARAVIAGQPFMDCETTPTQVLYLTEERESSFQNAMSRVGLLGCAHIHVLPRYVTMKMKWPDIMLMTSEEAARVGADLVICDTLSDWVALGGDAENNAGAALEAMRPLQEAAESGPAIIVCMHERKSGGDTVDAARGSSAFAGSVEIILSLGKGSIPNHENRRELRGVGRFDDIPTKLIVEMVEGHYASLGTSDDIERRAARKLCLDCLPSGREAAWTEKQLLERGTGELARSTMQRELKQLMAEGLVQRDKGAGEASNKAYGHWLTGETS